MKRPLLFAAWSGILAAIIYIFMRVFGFVLSLAGLNSAALILISLIFTFIIINLLVFFIYGFVVLGNRFKNNLLVVLSWIGIIINIILAIMVIAGAVLIAAGLVSATNLVTGMAVEDFNNSDIINIGGQNISLDAGDGGHIGEGEVVALIFAMLAVFFIIWLIIIIPLSAYSILWGVALMKLDKNNIELAKATGIVSIIAGATYVLLIGFVINFAVLIMEMILLFKASEKFERRVK